jgi:hypothetical protein
MGPVGSKRYVTVVCYDMQLDDGGGESKPFANLSLRVVEGPETGRNIYKRCYLSEAAAPISMKQLRALGWTGNKLSKAMSEGLGTRKANALLIVKDLKGKLVEDVKGIYEPTPRTTKNPVDSTSLEAFDALFEDVAAGVEAETPASDLNAAPPLPPAVSKTNGASTAPKANPNDLGF